MMYDDILATAEALGWHICRDIQDIPLNQDLILCNDYMDEDSYLFKRFTSYEEVSSFCCDNYISYWRTDK